MILEAQIRAVLAELYTSEGVEVWMTGRHRSLGGLTPMQVIAGGEGERVLRIAEMLRDGAFS